MSRKAKYTHFFSREDIKKALADRSEELLKVVPGTVLVFLVDQLQQFVPPEDQEWFDYDDWVGVGKWDLNIWFDLGTDCWFASLYWYDKLYSTKGPEHKITLIL